jgi:threonylcarbamoyladenosine tRNA methylthiotransferase MtaB
MSLIQIQGQIQDPMPTVAFYTFGCRLNQSESASLASAFSSTGYPVVENRQADIAVIQTCSVTETAETDCRRLIRKILRERPQTFIAVTGCYAQVGVEALLRIPGVDLIVGTEYKMGLPDRVREIVGRGPVTKQESPLVFHTPTIGREDFTVDHYAAFDHATRPNIKIQDGCDFFCTFCIIPYTRGRERSRKMYDILLEASVWAAQGKREIVLTGVNLGEYRSDGCDLADLIDALSEIEGLSRIRISSIEPSTVSPRLIEKMAQPSGKLCPYLHLPLQSGSNTILAEMGRRYTREEYADFVREVVTAIPHLGLGTDVMVGFPGEGEREFEETCDLIQQLPFSYLHVFPFSERKGTRVMRRGALPRVSPAVIQRRAAHLRDLSNRLRQAFYEKSLGQTVPVLFERREGSGPWSGLTPNYLRVGVESDAALTGQIADVLLERVGEGGIAGTLYPL